MRWKKPVCVLLLAAAGAAVSAGLQRLVEPKYMGLVVEGNFTSEYYEETTPHDVIFLGNCEVYENISPIVLWREFGITSYIRGNAQQLIAQSYYLLEDTLAYETPAAVVFNVSAMQQFEQDNESYNRMTMDGMRWSSSKWNAIRATRMEDEHIIEYIFPILRFHSRFKELEPDDLKYFMGSGKVAHNGYYLRADVRPAGDLPVERRRSDYSFDPRCWEYLEKIRTLCEQNGIRLVLMKAPSLYPAWYDQWEVQIEEYAAEHDLTYVNCLEVSDDIGIDFSTDTYDAGLHMNVYGAEKMARYWGPILLEIPGVEDRRGTVSGAARGYKAGIGLDTVWQEKCDFYDRMKASQEEEFARLGYIKQFYIQ